MPRAHPFSMKTSPCSITKTACPAFCAASMMASDVSFFGSILCTGSIRVPIFQRGDAMTVNLCCDSVPVPCANAYAAPAITYQDLIDDLAAGIKEKKLWKIGVELEQFAFDKATGGALPYDGTPGIRMLLE